MTRPINNIVWKMLLCVKHEFSTLMGTVTCENKKRKVQQPVFLGFFFLLLSILLDDHAAERSYRLGVIQMLLCVVLVPLSDLERLQFNFIAQL